MVTADTTTEARPRIAFVINSIGSGGAEGVLDTIMCAKPPEWDQNLIVLDTLPDKRDFSSSFTRHTLDSGGGLVSSVWRLHKLLDQLQPDIVVSFLVRANIANAMRAHDRPWRTIICERMHLSSHLAGRYGRVQNLILRSIIRISYRRADHVLAVSRGVGDDLHQRYGVSTDRLSVIPNPYRLAVLHAAASAASDFARATPYAVAVGRLVKAKGFDLLIEAWRRAAPDCQLVILGEGPCETSLRAQAAAAGLADQIVFAGYTAEPWPIMAGAKFFVSASRNEGFPNAMAEAMAMALPVVVTDCPSGPSELLETCSEPETVVRAPCGLIVPDGDVAALADAIAMLDADIDLRVTLGRAASQRLDAFDSARITQRYWDKFAAVARDD